MPKIEHTEYRITFQPGNRSVYSLSGTTIMEAAVRAGLSLQSPCGGNGTCGKCRVRVITGGCPPSPAGREQLTAAELRRGTRLACQARIRADCVIEIPDESLFETSALILVAAETHELTGHPALSKHYLELPGPEQNDDCPDTERLERALQQPLKIPLQVLRELPQQLRNQKFSGTAVLHSGQLLGFEAGDTTAVAYGVAFDLGTTTVVASLMNLVDGREVAVAATMNPQIEAGDDVISRIHKTREESGALDQMRGQIAGTLNQLITELVAQTGIEPTNIYEITIAGNTAMQHIFCGISPAALGEIPFVAACRKGVLEPASGFGLDIHPQAPLYVFPSIGGFVGGDTVAGIMAGLLHTSRQNRVLIDIGTNGEIVAAFNNRLLAASTAAGPAFEGARIVHGMRATSGAIEKIIAINGDLDYNVIGNCPPIGLCGSALIDLVAELLRWQVVDSTGRILPPAQLPDSVPPAIRDRVQAKDGETGSFLVVKAGNSGQGRDIIVFQRDLRELQLAAGAIRAGLNILLQRAGLELTQIDQVLLAGAFGNFIRRENARRIGLLPQLPNHKIKCIGNAASIGAKLALLSSENRRLAEKIAARCEHLELSSDLDFQREFAMAMLFPEQELAE